MNLIRVELMYFPCSPNIILDLFRLLVVPYSCQQRNISYLLERRWNLGVPSAFTNTGRSIFSLKFITASPTEMIIE